jgi:hypothetical protein
MSRQVTAVYVEESTVARFSIGAQDNVLDLKHRACLELANTAQRYGFKNGFPCGDIGSIVLSSGIKVHYLDIPNVVTYVLSFQARMVNLTFSPLPSFRRFANPMILY